MINGWWCSLLSVLLNEEKLLKYLQYHHQSRPSMMNSFHTKELSWTISLLPIQFIWGFREIQAIIPSSFPLTGKLAEFLIEVFPQHIHLLLIIDFWRAYLISELQIFQAWEASASLVVSEEFGFMVGRRWKEANRSEGEGKGREIGEFVLLCWYGREAEFFHGFFCWKKGWRLQAFMMDEFLKDIAFMVVGCILSDAGWSGRDFWLGLDWRKWKRGELYVVWWNWDLGVM